MPRFFVGNFHFEHELAAPSGWKPSAALQRMSAERVVSWIPLADDGDMIWTPEPIPDEFWESLTKYGLPRVRGILELDPKATSTSEIVPWGWSEWTRAIGRQTASPSDESVRRGNSRLWSFALEQELGVALPGAARLERIDDFAATVSRSANEFGEPAAEHGWVVKANFGMAGRERLLGRGPNLTSAQESWLIRRLDAEGAVFFEPWLRRRTEAGLQWTIPSLGQGEPKWEGLTPLLCDAQGGYRGSEFSLDTRIPHEWQHAIEISEQAAQRLQSLGYFGPLGIDAAIYEDVSGISHVRPLQDINARHAMGRLALGFRRLLSGDERGIWRHGRCEELPPHTSIEIVREIDLTPPIVGDRPPMHGSRLTICRTGFQPVLPPIAG